jgi:hypothetical protein
MNEIFSNCRASLVYEFKYFNTIFMSDEGVAIKNKQIYLNLKKKKWKTKCGISGSKSEQKITFL